MPQLTVFLPVPGLNPYLHLLSTHLIAQDVKVRPLPPVLTREWLTSRSGEWSVLHFHWPSYAYTALTQIETASRLRSWLTLLDLAHALGYRIAWTAHNLYPHDALHEDLQHAARVELLRRTDLLVVYCDRGKHIIESTFGPFGGETVVMNHGSLAGYYGRAVSPQEACQYLDIPKVGTRFLYFGLIRPYKGLDALIEAFNGAAPETHLVIAGAPSSVQLGRQLMAIAGGRPNVTVHPFLIPNEDVRYYMSAANIVVMPYRTAFTSGVAVLAHSFGKPVIAPAVGCLPDLIPPGTGRLFSGTVAMGLRSAISEFRTLLTDDVSQACSAYALELRWDNLVKTLIIGYHAVLQRR